MKTKQYYEKLLYSIDEFVKSYPSVFEYVLEHPQFYVQSGAGYDGQHHFGTGGLSDHVYEVIKLCLNNCPMFKDIDKPVLITSALYHDIGKLWDYKQDKDGNWINTEHKRRIHHISKSAMIFFENANKAGLDIETRDKIIHCILSHHTSREHGSPVAPKTKEAWMLTLCDNMSARMTDCESWDYICKRV